MNRVSLLPLSPLGLFGVCTQLGVAVLESTQDVYFFRLPLRAIPPTHFEKLYTVNTIGKALTVHFGRYTAGSGSLYAYCDGPSDEGWSGGPVVDKFGHVVGLLKGTAGAVDKKIITTEGLLCSLRAIEPSRNWKHWNVEQVVYTDALETKFRNGTTELIGTQGPIC